MWNYEFTSLSFEKRTGYIFLLGTLQKIQMHKKSIFDGLIVLIIVFHQKAGTIVVWADPLHYYDP